MKKQGTPEYGKVKLFAKITSPVFSALFYVFVVFFLVLIIMSLILAIVNVTPDKLLLPPFMHLVHENGQHTGYNLYVGNGIRIFAEKNVVTLAAMKKVIYSGIIVLGSFCLAAAPFCRFMARLFKNLGAGMVFAAKNPRYIHYIGLDVMLGVTLYRFVSRFYNYNLVKHFAADASNVHLSLSVDYSGILIGLLILLFGCIYGYACGVFKQISEKEETKSNLPKEQ